MRQIKNKIKRVIERMGEMGNIIPITHWNKNPY